LNSKASLIDGVWSTDLDWLLPQTMSLMLVVIGDHFARQLYEMHTGHPS